MQLPMPDVVITHESDLDGLLAGVLLQRLARKLFDTDVRLEAYHYNLWKQRELREKSAWVTDFAFEARLDKPNWLVVDHHVTEVKPQNGQLIHDVNKSAGLLCYELCREPGLGSPTLDRLVHLNNVADLFLEDDPDFVLAGDYANLVKIYGFWNLHALLGADIEKLLDHPLPAQPQRRGDQGRGKTSGRRPRQCLRRHHAAFREDDSRRRLLSAPGVESEKEHAPEQPRKLVLHDGKPGQT